MFLNGTNSYDRNGEQKARGDFLVVFKGDGPQMFACVRPVTLRQCGHFMTGRAQIGGAYVYVEGSYGYNGLPCNLDEIPADIGATLVPVPDALYQAWATGNGWNTSGAEGPDMRAWARENIDALKKAGRAKQPSDLTLDGPEDQWSRCNRYVLRRPDGSAWGAYVTYGDGNARRYWTSARGL